MIFKIILTKPFAVGFILKICVIDQLVGYVEVIHGSLSAFFPLTLLQ